jgi:lipopolysaccharide exporter
MTARNDDDSALPAQQGGNLERRMARSAAWMVSLRLADRGIGLISVLILARLLVPADFGVVAMGTVILGALEAAAAFGFELALIKSRAHDRERLDTAWTLNIVIGLLLGTTLVALIPAAIRLYDDPRVQYVMLVLAAMAAVGGLRNIGMVKFEQDLRFGSVVVLALARRMAAFTVTLTVALVHGTYWSLLAGMLAGHAVDAALSFVISDYRPRLRLSAWRELFSFSKWLVLNNLLTFAASRGGDLVVGSRAGATAVGTYTVSFELANLPTTEMVWPVMRAVFPGYALMAHDRDRLAQGFERVYSLVLLFALPAAAGIALLAEPFVLVLLGARWTDAIALVQVLALYGAVRAAQANTWSAYLALDRPQLIAVTSGLNITLAFGGFAIALVSLPIDRAAWFLVGGSVVAGIVNLAVLARTLRLAWSDLGSAFARPLLGIAVMALLLPALLDMLWSRSLSAPMAAAALLALVLLGAASYVAAVLLAWRVLGRPTNSPERAVLEVLGAMMRRHRTA